MLSFSEATIICFYSFKVLISWVNLTYCEKAEFHKYVYSPPLSNWKGSDGRGGRSFENNVETLRTKSEPMKYVGKRLCSFSGCCT